MKETTKYREIFHSNGIVKLWIDENGKTNFKSIEKYLWRDKYHRWRNEWTDKMIHHVQGTGR